MKKFSESRLSMLKTYFKENSVVFDEISVKEEEVKDDKSLKKEIKKKSVKHKLS